MSYISKTESVFEEFWPDTQWDNYCWCWRGDTNFQAPKDTKALEGCHLARYEAILAHLD